MNLLTLMEMLTLVFLGVINVVYVSCLLIGLRFRSACLLVLALLGNDLFMVFCVLIGWRMGLVGVWILLIMLKLVVSVVCFIIVVMLFQGEMELEIEEFNTFLIGILFVVLLGDVTTGCCMMVFGL